MSAGGTRGRSAQLATLAIVASALLAVLTPQALATTPALPAGTAVARLSDLRTVSRWAYPSSEAVVRAAPAEHARAIGRLRFLTPDGQAELYVALVSAQMGSGESWTEIELPARPNGQRGWVPSGALGAMHSVDGYLLVNRRTLRATLYRDGHEIFRAPVGVGKASTRTPGGHFYVMEKLRTANAPVYGPLALGTSAYAPTLSEWPGGGVVGIHGTNEPQLVPGRPSHGCIRMRNADIVRLWRTIVLGTPIEII